MPQINILNILQGDNQSAIVDKINYNFDQILSAGGGPQGARGLVGTTGPIGPQGGQGPQGLQGPSGSKWFVQDTAPASGAVTGGNPWTYPTLGDYWIDPDSPNQSIYVLGSTGWINTGFGLGVGSLFQKINPININGGATAQAILFAGATSSDQTLVLSDASIATYTPGGNAINNLNFENSKLKIATKDSRTKLISFGRSDFDNTPGGSGGLSSGNNPYFSWDSSTNPSGASGAGPGFYGISFTNPRGSIGIKSLPSDTSEGGINIISSSEVTQQASDNISLITQTPNKGTFLSSSNINQGGFVEFSYQPTSTPSNQANAYMFANSTGLGLGLGTGQFKQTGDDSRRLAVSGNVSISKSLSGHSSQIFIGDATSNNYNKGSIFVQGQGAFGAGSPINSYYPSSFGGAIISGNSTGPSESQNRFPLFWVTSADRGPAFQVKTLGTSTPKGASVFPRTTIGDASSEFSLETVSSLDRVSGRLSDISQVVQINPAPLGGAPITSGPVFSYQHKIHSAGTTSSNQPIFSITTHVNGTLYNEDNYANKTIIQTLNSNPNLTIQANSTGQAEGNSVSIGARSNNLLKVYGGNNAGPTAGTVTIGASADSYTGTRQPLTQSTFPQVNDPLVRNPIDNHSLVVPGVVTIGTDDPRSRFNTILGKGNSALFGANSMLKISRSLFTGTTPSQEDPNVIFAAGPNVNNYANGLEITSYIAESETMYPYTGTANRSVAIAVGASNVLKGPELTPPFTGYRNNPDFTATGFFVSNTGMNVAIGDPINPDVALVVRKPYGSNQAAMINGNVNVTGAFRVNGSVTATGTVSISGNVSVTGGNLSVNGRLSCTQTFSVGGVTTLSQYIMNVNNQMFVNNGSDPGIKMISTGYETIGVMPAPTPINSTATRYLKLGTGTELILNNSSTDSVVWPVKDYDRIIYVTTSNIGDSTNSRIEISVGVQDDDDSLAPGSALVVRDKVFDGYSTRSFILPAGRTFRILISPSAAMPTGYRFSIYSQKFGI